MSTFDIISFTSADKLAEVAARQWLSEIASANVRTDPFCVALSGGRIAREFFSAAAGLGKGKPSAFTAVHFFWSDERCVPPEDPESNFALAQEFLLGPLSIPEDQIHRIRGEEPPKAAADEAQSEVMRIVPTRSKGQPVLDLVFLGMGEDGHVASLFPEEPEELMRNEAVYRPVLASKPPPHRITMDYPAIAAARQVWVLASGAGKEQVLRGALGPGGKTPLTRVLKMRSHTKIFTDIPLEIPPQGFSQSKK